MCSGLSSAKKTTPWAEPHSMMLLPPILCECFDDRLQRKLEAASRPKIGESH